MRRTALLAAGGLCLGWAAAAGPAGAQRAPVPVACRGQRIDAMRIVSQAPSVAGVRNVPVISEVARTVHVTTQPNVIDRFLLLHPGDRCDERRRAESERVLRAQPFIADATILVLSDDRGGVELEVRTIDEVAAIFSATMKASGPLVTGLRLGDANAAGEGIYVMGNWWHDYALRDGYAFNVTDYQFLGNPLQATASAARNPLGGEYHLDVQLPFLTDLQRMAWRVQDGESDDYVRFVDGTGGVHADRLAHRYADIGGLARIGAPGRLALLGFSVSHSEETPGAIPIGISDAGATAEPGSLLAGRYPTHSVSRINALVGYRNLKYVRAVGFDALSNVQDVPIGIQVGALVGKSAPVLGSSARDMLVGGDLYAGHATPNTALRLQMIGEIRRELATGTWDGLLGSGRLADYQRLGGSQMLTTSLEWSGGWRVQVPFRVSLAGTDGGVRGMAEGLEQGGRRAIARVEDRWIVPTRLGGTADIGFAVFADAGRLWAGDVPWGTTSPVRYSGGVSILAAVPSHSARMWRLDIAVPNVPGRGFRLALRLSHDDGANVFWREPADVAMARDRSVPASLFNWP